MNRTLVRPAAPTGLSTEEARRRLEARGPNETVGAPRSGPALQLLRFCMNPLVLILLLASGLSAALGEITNASLVAVMVLLSIGLNFVQTYRSEGAARRLRGPRRPSGPRRRARARRTRPAASSSERPS